MITSPGLSWRNHAPLDHPDGRPRAPVDGEGRLDELLRTAAEANVAFKDVSFGARGGSMLIPLLNVPDWVSARKQLTAAFPALELTERVTVVSVVGDGLAATPEPLRRFLAALREAEGAPLAVTATPLRLSAVIGEARAGAAQRTLHQAFVV